MCGRIDLNWLVTQTRVPIGAVFSAQKMLSVEANGGHYKGGKYLSDFYHRLAKHSSQWFTLTCHGLLADRQPTSHYLFGYFMKPLEPLVYFFIFYLTYRQS